MLLTIVDVLFPIAAFLLGLSEGLENDVLGYVAAGLVILIGAFVFIYNKQQIAQKDRDQSDDSE